MRQAGRVGGVSRCSGMRRAIGPNSTSRSISAECSLAHFADWGERYLDSDPGARRRDPPGVQVPSGPLADIAQAWAGALPYDPARVQAPVAIIRGEWDHLIPDADARWLFDAFTAAPIKRDIKISRATHLMHLERMRCALHRESIAFLQGDDQAPMPSS